MFVYDCNTKKWAEVPDEPISETAQEPEINPSFEERIEAQILYTALMTDTLLEE